MEDALNPERILASAAKFLIEGGDDDAASVLLSCSLTIYAETPDPMNDASSRRTYAYLVGPRAAYDVLSNNRNPLNKAIWSALVAVLPFDCYLWEVEARAEVANIGSDWRAELTELARGKTIDNQAATARKFRLYNNLRFQSASEVKIAEALDKAGVMYFPLCRGRMGTDRNRVNREPDFLVCHNGKWGILEVDGEPFHPPSRTVDDHERDRLFKAHGVVVVEHFDAKPCYEFPDAVVKKFLAILAANG